MDITEEKNKIKVFLIGICLDTRKFEKTEISLEELSRLAETAEMEVVEKFIQNRKKISSATYVGKGFLEDIKNKMDFCGAELVVFDNELSPTQSRNISKNFGIEVIDRTELILAIFQRHARTNEAKLEVKLAELKYQLPRLKKLWSHLDRERGASGSGKGASRGMGEKQIQIDKRIIREEIRTITHELEKIMKQKIVQRKNRQTVKKVCLVGYTNAGKSSLFNRLTGEHMLVEDKLFATLDSTARKMELGKGRNIILSDTVGFISSLPHNLIASFRATLKDVMDADLLVHVVDISDDECEDHIVSVKEVLEEINADKIPHIIAFNKIDILSEYRVREEIFNDKYPNSVSVSAVTGENIDTLTDLIDNRLNEYSKYFLFFPFEEQEIIAKIHNYAVILNKEFTDYGVKITAVINSEDIYRIKDYIIEPEDNI